MDAITIRVAQAGDLALAAAHYLAMRRELGWPDGELDPDFVALFAATYADGAASGESRYFVAEHGGDVVGSAVALRRRSLSERYLKSRPTGYLANLYVDPPHRRHGAARALTSAVIGWLASLGCTVVRLQASRFGRPLYESMGFVSTGEMELRL